MTIRRTMAGRGRRGAPRRRPGGEAAGRLWRAPMEAVLGAEVAATMRLAVGATFTGAHGLAAGGDAHDEEPFKVVGVLAPTGSVLDRLVLTSVESVWEIHEHAGKPD